MSSFQHSLVNTNLDFEKDGVQYGALRVPYSHDRSAYGYVPIPAMVAKRGDGPTLLLTGANHGDEYEGPVALTNLMREFPIDSFNGRLIVVPALNLPAYLAGTRTSPIDHGNLNRSFPGNRNGTVTEIIAHYVETVLIPLADYAIDFHAGGSSLNYLPTLFVDRPATLEETHRLERLLTAFSPPRAIYWDYFGEDRVLGAAASRHKTFFMTGEFGGGATVNLDGLKVVREGIAGVLGALNMLPGSEPSEPARSIRRLEVQPEHYVSAPCGGIFEPRFRLGDEVTAGQLAGLIHDPVTPWREPVSVEFNADGVALCIRTFALVQPGDCLGHLGRDLAA
ncbi:MULTISPECIES: succinylglutamate desuccinylase/aspartoacylase family protein [Paraburkholderia]|uniref:Succinylglutamate desuccinylase/aspartoacylase family protein n=1 Tax=Paraburkholderia metrosideri TaxID=580937 RepID=A0ABW9E2S6_9BURK